MLAEQEPLSAPLSVALVINRYFDFGGLQKEMLRIAKELLARGHQVEVITSDWEGETIEGIDTHVAPFTTSSNHNKMRELATTLEKRRHEKKFDCVIGFNKIPGIDFYFAGDVCLAEKIDKEKSPFVKFLPRYKQYLKFEKAVFSQESHTHILLLAHGAQSTYKDYYQTTENRFHPMPPGVAKDRFSMDFDRPAAQSELRSKWKIPANAKVIIHVGSAFKRKGADRIISAISELPQNIKSNTWLFIIGDDKKEKFERLAMRLGVKEQVIFTGAQQDVSLFYQGADLLVHPAREECTGMTIMEGMYCGLPVITTENAGFAWHVKNAKAGKIVDYPYSQDQLNHYIKEIISLTPEQWQTLSENAQHYCRTEEIHNLSQAAVDVVESVMKNALKTK